MLAADGKVDAQPLYLSQLTVAGAAHNVVFVATENDSVYAFDADTGTHVVAGVAAAAGRDLERQPHGCSQVTPNIGITSTPGYRPQRRAHGAIYVVAMSQGPRSSAYHQRLHALDVTSGAELLNGPVEITRNLCGRAVARPPSSRGSTRSVRRCSCRRASIYTSWTSHCDAPPYSGWMMGYSQTTLAQTAVLNIAPNSSGSGRRSGWQAAVRPPTAAGNIYLLTANGAFETSMDANGFPNKQDYGNSFLKIAATGGTLAVADYFTMSNEVAESNADEDLGSGGELLLPDLTDSSGTDAAPDRRGGQGRQHLCRQSRLHGQVQLPAATTSGSS